MAKVTKDGEHHSTEAKSADRNSGGSGGRSLAELTIVIDPGHGGDDNGSSTTDKRFLEKKLNLRVAILLGKALETLGSKVVMTREEDVTVPLYDRPASANATNGDIFLSIHHDYDPERDVEWVAGYFFCRQGYFSEAGSLLAQHIIDSMAASLDVPALPAMGRNFAVLRETEMTSVMIEPHFLTASSAGNDDIDALAAREAEAVLAGLRDYFTG